MATQVKEHRRVAAIFSIGAFVAAVVFIAYLMMAG